MELCSRKWRMVQDQSMGGSVVYLDEIRIVDFPCHHRHDGELVVLEMATGMPFAIARIFTLCAPAGAERGKHAHRLCSQLMLCVHGAVDIRCDDGAGHFTVPLDRGNRALLIPPMIWSTVVFREPQSVLSVLCDRPYEADDYVRDYGKFVRLRSGSAS